MAGQERLRGRLLPVRVCRGHRGQGAQQPQHPSQRSDLEHSAPPVKERLLDLRVAFRADQARAEETRQAHHLLPKLHPFKTGQRQTEKERHLEGASVWLRSW